MYGNLYIADSFNFVIRMVARSTGIISTLAGTGVRGFSGNGGFAISAKLGLVSDVAIGMSFSTAGNVYIADSSNNVILMVSKSTGIITVVAGTGVEGYSGDGGLATSATLNRASGVFVDIYGKVYIADTTNAVIRAV